jgi:nuclear transport factor 2 (NTF2) superfamily protein
LLEDLSARADVQTIRLRFNSWCVTDIIAASMAALGAERGYVEPDNADSLMQLRHASINDLQIDDADRKLHWPQGPRPVDHPSLTELGL